MNGTGPPLDLLAEDYNAVKSGVCITSGTYEGCIQVGEVYHWFKHEEGKDNWARYTGTPDDHAEMTSDVWDHCKEGGDYVYNSKKKGFVYNGDDYQWKSKEGIICLTDV